MIITYMVTRTDLQGKNYKARYKNVSSTMAEKRQDDNLVSALRQMLLSM